MSADLLHRAAKVLREHAEKATGGQEWCANLLRGAIRHVFRNVDSESYLPSGCDEHGLECGRPGMYDGRYVALMHPPVALALADLLDECAESVEQEGGIVQDSTTAGCVDVARAVLREES